MTKQRRPISGARLAQGALLGALCLATPAARAADCSTLTNPVYVAGSSAAKPFVKVIAAALLAQNINVVYQGQGSCVGVGYLTSTPTGAITGTGVTWDAQGNEIAGGCALDLAPGNTVDIGISDVWAESCGATLPSDVKDTFGPIQSMNFIVPDSSTQTSISYEAAYLTFGLGDTAGNVAPWLDHTKYEIRKPSSGTLMMTANTIDVPGAKWIGNQNADSTAVLGAVEKDATDGNAEQSIGILSSDSADQNRGAGKVKALAYQHKGQSCGYLPDSTAQSFDKQNVRDGHYMIWGPIHLLTKKAPSTNTQLIIDYLSGAKIPTAFDLIKTEAKGSVVPDCAMRVTRTSEGGALMSYMPPISCECKFIAEATGTAPASCTTCTQDSDCKTSGAPKCHFGYCEVQ